MRKVARQDGGASFADGNLAEFAAENEYAALLAHALNRISQRSRQERSLGLHQPVVVAGLAAIPNIMTGPSSLIQLPRRGETGGAYGMEIYFRPSQSPRQPSWPGLFFLHHS